VEHHRRGLRRLWKQQGVDLHEQQTQLDALADPSRPGPWSEADQTMLNYALKLTAAPADICEDDIRSLRDQGFDDRAIHDICGVTAYFAFVNRIADGLGVELESGFDKQGPAT